MLNSASITNSSLKKLCLGACIEAEIKNYGMYNRFSDRLTATFTTSISRQVFRVLKPGAMTGELVRKDWKASVRSSALPLASNRRPQAAYEACHRPTDGDNELLR
jgi:hypothetical protein